MTFFLLHVCNLPIYGRFPAAYQRASNVLAADRLVDQFNIHKREGVTPEKTVNKAEKGAPHCLPAWRFQDMGACSILRTLAFNLTSVLTAGRTPILTNR